MMMNFDYGPMMGWGGGWGAFSLLFWAAWVVWLLVGVFLMIWLWQKINKK